MAKADNGLIGVERPLLIQSGVSDQQLAYIQRIRPLVSDGLLPCHSRYPGFG